MASSKMKFGVAFATLGALCPPPVGGIALKMRPQENNEVRAIRSVAYENRILIHLEIVEIHDGTERFLLCL